MKLLLIRHGEPDSPRDALTPAGREEAALLAEYLSGEAIDELFVSPLVRARDTAAPLLEKTGRTGVTLPWLAEFEIPIRRSDLTEPHGVPWDWPPALWLSEPRFLDLHAWREVPVMKEAGVGEAYDRVVSAFDGLLEARGYRREGFVYRAERPNARVLAFFCHFGLSCVLLSHLMNVSPMVLWHGMALPPSSITTVWTEERRPGVASFRAASLGATPHLTLAGRAPSFSARFCEIYGNGDRVD